MTKEELNKKQTEEVQGGERWKSAIVDTILNEGEGMFDGPSYRCIKCGLTSRDYSQKCPLCGGTMLTV